MYFCIRLAGRRISMLFITKGSTSHTVGGKNCMKQVGFFVCFFKWNKMDSKKVCTHQKASWSSWQESPNSLMPLLPAVSLLNWPNSTSGTLIAFNITYSFQKTMQILILHTPCWTTDSGKRFSSNSSISAFSKVLKHCSVAFSSISHCTRPGSVSKSPENEKKKYSSDFHKKHCSLSYFSMQVMKG